MREPQQEGFGPSAGGEVPGWAGELEQLVAQARALQGREAALKRTLAHWKLVACLALLALAVTGCALVRAGHVIGEDLAQMASATTTLQQETMALTACNGRLAEYHAAVARAVAAQQALEAQAQDSADVQVKQEAARHAALLRFLMAAVK